KNDRKGDADQDQDWRHSFAEEYQYKGRKNQGSTRVLLEKDQKHWNPDEGEQCKLISQVVHTESDRADRLGHDERRRKLGELRWLHPERPNAKPSLVTPNLFSYQGNEEKQDKHQAVNDVGEGFKELP